jgi:chromosomal replication initiation ATPase DnaA
MQKIKAQNTKLFIQEEIFSDKDNFKTWFIKTYHERFNEVPYISTVDIVNNLKNKNEKKEKYFYEVIKCVSIVLYNDDVSNKIFEKNRKQEVVLIRKMASYIMVNKLKFTLCSTAKLFNKNHATILHHCKSMCDILEVDIELRRKYILIENLLLEKGIMI